jgi:hypothetical protein
MKFLILLAASVAASHLPTTLVAKIHSLDTAVEACNRLSTAFPQSVFLVGSPSYNQTSHMYWDLRSSLSPKCMFAPSVPSQISAALKILIKTKTLFSVKGGGHTAIPGYNSIDSRGVLITLERLVQLEFSDDKKILKVGTGNLWGDVYNFAGQQGRVVVGGRVPTVGVGGLALGGGLSFLGNQRGFACDNILGYEVVLASGEVVYATKDNHFKILFKALKGGGQSLGIVTRFDLKVYSLPTGWGGVNNVVLSDPAVQSRLLDAISTYHLTGQHDVDSGVIFEFLKYPSMSLDIGTVDLFYSKPVTSTPKVFEEFVAIPGTPDLGGGNFGPTTLDKFIADSFSMKGGGEGEARNIFRTTTIRARKEAFYEIHRLFEAEFKPLSDEQVPDLSIALVFQPISKTFIEAGQRAGGNMMNLKAEGAPYSIVATSVSWSSPTDDDKVRNTNIRLFKKIEDYAKKVGIHERFMFMNDADGDQDVISGYGQVSKNYLKRVQKVYDPERVFTRLMPGGWKIDFSDSLYSGQRSM